VCASIELIKNIDEQEWEKYVYSRYLPCSVLYEDDSVTNSFVPGKHCAFSFTHEAAKGMDMSMAKKYAENVLAILQKGAVPAITEVHAQRVCSQGFPPLIPESLKQQVKTFDAHSVSKNVEGLFALHPGSIRVERIVTSMGCLVTTCIAEVDQLMSLTQGIMSWAKPIMEANNFKAKVCMEWRKTLEREACMPPVDPASRIRMQVGALYVPEGTDGGTPLGEGMSLPLSRAEDTSQALQDILKLE
jgi:hypothetical protein